VNPVIISNIIGKVKTIKNVITTLQVPGSSLLLTRSNSHMKRVLFDK